MNHTFRALLVSLPVLLFVATPGTAWARTTVATGIDTDAGNVSIVDKGAYYQVILDYTTGATHREIGEEYGRRILETVPDFEVLLDSYLAEMVEDETFYRVLLRRAKEIKPQVQRDYLDELEGIASVVAGSDESIPGDDRLSFEEFYVLSFLPDIMRVTQCSGIGIHAARSETGSTMGAKLLDWHAGSQHQLAQIQAVVTFKNGDQSFCSVGYLGVMSAMNSFNRHGIFAGAKDAGTGEPYRSDARHSYSFDLRYALERFSTMDEIARFMKSPNRRYAYSHAMVLWDADSAIVIENNISDGPGHLRAIRRADSPLNEGVEWGIDDAIACVNSFVLKGNHDNHSWVGNSARWQSIREVMLSMGETISFEDLKKIATYHRDGEFPGSQEDGNIYHEATQQILLFKPADFHLEVFFRPKDGTLPRNPQFERIDVLF